MEAKEQLREADIRAYAAESARRGHFVLHPWEYGERYTAEKIFLGLSSISVTAAGNIKTVVY
jgi:hypothetical protein